MALITAPWPRTANSSTVRSVASRATTRVRSPSAPSHSRDRARLSGRGLHRAPCERRRRRVTGGKALELQTRRTSNGEWSGAGQRDGGLPQPAPPGAWVRLVNRHSGRDVPGRRIRAPAHRRGPDRNLPNGHCPCGLGSRAADGEGRAGSRQQRAEADDGERERPARGRLGHCRVRHLRAHEVVDVEHHHLIAIG